jgi:hypothetical protein
LIGDKDAAAESAFAEACRRHLTSTVGVLDGIPINYLHLAEHLPPPPPTCLEEMGSVGQKLDAALKSHLHRLSLDHHQFLGRVGFLTFDLQYRRERTALQARWLALPDRPPLPLTLGPALPVPSIDPLRQNFPSEDVSAFLHDLDGFLRKWDLIQLVTWDLPDPQGPLGGLPLGAVVNLLGPDHPVSTYPKYYDVPSGEDLRERLREMQRRAARHAGIEQEYPVTDTSARGESASSYESAFRLWLIEKSVITRYGRRRGLVGRLVHAFSEMLGVGTDRVRQLREVYRRCLDDPSPSR